MADPADITLRMVYADWLEDDGQHSRAEFVRYGRQIEAAIADGDSWFIGGDRPPNIGPMIGPMKRIVDIMRGTDGATFMFRHGFVHRVVCDIYVWLARGKDIVSEFPVEVITPHAVPAAVHLGDGPYSGPNGFGWYPVINRRVNPQSRGYIPQAILDHMVGQECMDHVPTPNWYRFHTEKEAYKALSDAALVWAGARHMKTVGAAK